MILRRLVLLGIAAIVVVTLIGAGGWFYFLTFSPDRAKYPVRGIDVSHHQGSIDWRLVAKDDVSFAIIKATEGGDYVDPEFLGNYLAARSLGLAVGAYHFFTFCRPAGEQADNFIRTVPKGQPQLPPVVDIEFAGNCAQRPTPEDLSAELEVFLDKVEAAFGQPVMIYIIGDALEVYGAAMPERLRWTRSIAWPPDSSNWTVWQYHNRGRVQGIAEPVDLNVLQGGPAALALLQR